jgi:hypothetical protein
VVAGKIHQVFAEEVLKEIFIHLFTGEPIRFEASPGNVLLRPATREDVPDAQRIKPGPWYWDYELVWHDLDGAEAFGYPVRPPRSK